MSTSTSRNGEKHLLPISDTVSGSRAREAPEDVLAHYARLSERLWMPPQLQTFAEEVFESVAAGRTTWASLSGPYGFGKTAAGILVWQHARDSGFLAIPPLSCTNYDEFASGVAALAESQAPKDKARIRKLFEEIWTDGLDRVARAEAKRHDLPVRKLRQVLQGQFQTGRWTPDGHSHRLVEFLARLSELAARWSRGLVVLVDELQQLLGPLDVSSLSRLREFVWGMRTEQSPCGLVLSLDSQLEARLGHWAADLLHRVREHSPALQMTGVFTRTFPTWLWERLTEAGGRQRRALAREALTTAVLTSLGQFVERPDLANGPRTVIDVFSRAAEHYGETRESYDVPHLVEDLHRGRFRFFGEGTPVQRLLTQLLSDDWVQGDAMRASLVRTLAAFPRGCPADVLHAHVGNGRKLKSARDELFGPLLVELPEGLALEQMQQVARGGSPWEQVLARAWDTLPGLSALGECAPELVSRVLLPRLFPGLDQPAGEWAAVQDDIRTAIGGFHLLRGSFDAHFPQREVAVWIGDREPASWPEDVDLCVGLLCSGDGGGTARPTCALANLDGTPRILLSMPILTSLDDTMPQELARHQKYIQPEPFRPAFVLTALRDLQAYAAQEKIEKASPESNGTPAGRAGRRNGASVDTGKVAALRRMEAFQEVCLDYLLHVLLQGDVDIGVGRPVRQRGSELLRSLFSLACRSRFPDYRTLITARHWKEVLAAYRGALQSENLTLPQRRGQQPVALPKAEAYKILFSQNSTAAGDSLVRTLGPLAEVSQQGPSWSIRLTLHPAETALLGYLRSVARKQAVPREAAAEFLRHRGYVQVEAAEVIELLLARELLTSDRHQQLRSASDHVGTAASLRQRIGELCTQLRRLGEEPAGDGSEATTVTALQEQGNALESALGGRMATALGERRRQAEELQSLVGRVRGITVVTSWPKTELTTHLSGMAQTLGKTQGTLLQGLRREHGVVEQDLAVADPVTFDWTLKWGKRRDSACRAVSKLRDRVAEFEGQSRALLRWLPLIQQFSATDVLCAKVEQSNAAPRELLGDLLAEFRSRFSTEGWGPLGDADTFRARLQPIEAQVQALVFSQAKAFYGEMETLRERFVTLLPRTPPPAFDPPGSGNRASSALSAFHALYRWAREGFSEAFGNATRLRSDKVPWSDTRGRRRSWSDVAGPIEGALKSEETLTSFAALVALGERLGDLFAGFRCDRDGGGVYDDPQEVPDFEAMRELFLRGQLVIRVERKA